MAPLFSLFRVQARYWLRHRLQVTLCLAGIVLGVAVFCAIQLANRGALRSFAEDVETFAGVATHRVTAPGGGGLPDFLIPLLARAEGVRAATPVSTGYVVVREGQPPGSRLPLTVLGIDPLADPSFRGFSLPDADGSATDMAEAETGGGIIGGISGGINWLETLLGVPGAVLVPRPLAVRLGIAPGAEFEVETPSGRAWLRMAGAFEIPPGSDSRMSRTLIADVSTHQELFGRQGKLDEILLIADPGAASNLAVSNLSALLPPGAVLEKTGGQVERVEKMSSAFRLNLESLGLFAILVAVFLIFNAATFSVAQRRYMIAMERCIGATARGVFLSLLLEAIVLGALGSLGGVLLGWWLGAVMLQNTGATLFEVVLQTRALPASVELSASIWLSAFALGIGSAAAGSFFPALRAARISPLAGVKGARSAPAREASLRWWLWVGGTALALAALLLLWPGKAVWAGLAGATAIVLGGAALTPPFVMLTGRVAAPVLGKLLGTPGRMAAANLARGLSRAGAASAALMVALSLALAIGITVRSFKQTFRVWLGQVVSADVYLQPRDDDLRHPIPKTVLEGIDSLPFVKGRSEIHFTRVTLADRVIVVLGFEMPVYGRNVTLPSRDGSSDEIFRRLAAGDPLITETLAFPLGLEQGDTLVLPTPGGERRFTVGAVFQNYLAIQGGVYMNLEQFSSTFGRSPPHEAAVWFKPGTDPAEALLALESLPGAERVRWVPNGELRASALEIFDRTFVITDLMGALAALVAFIAVASALMALLEERTRTLGMLRAIGVSRAGLIVSMMLEATLLAGASAIASWGVGLMMAVALIFVVNLRAFGWTLQFLPGEGSYGSLLALALAAALLGSIYPVIRAARLSIAATLREE